MWCDVDGLCDFVFEFDEFFEVVFVGFLEFGCGGYGGCVLFDNVLVC